MNTQTHSKLIYFLVVTALVGTLIAGCAQTPAVPAGTVVGSGKVINETRDVTGFTAVAFSAPGYLTITQGDADSLNIQADDNVLSSITTEVVDGVLDIGLAANTNLKSDSMIQYTLVVKDLSSLENMGAGYILVNGLKTTDFNFKSSNAGSAKLTGIEATALTIELTGAGSMDISGTADSLALTNSSATVFNGKDLAVNSAVVTVSGAGETTVNAAKTLDATLTSSGNLLYAGTPEITQKVTGSGTLSAIK